ncbi:MAG: sulfur carrier protein ThiS [Cocleimonas sp.]|nr:sulfur carrier protein ThiS [Cocleimonas sp.]
MELTLNGEPKELPDVMSLDKAIAHWQPEVEQFAVAVNGEFVPRGSYAETLLKANDQVELLSPIVGG